MGRGRNATASEVRVLLELLLQDDELLRYPDIAENLPIGDERVRQILEDLEDDGYVSIQQHGANFYRLTDDGYEHLANELRERID